MKTLKVGEVMEKIDVRQVDPNAFVLVEDKDFVEPLRDVLETFASGKKIENVFTTVKEELTFNDTDIESFLENIDVGQQELF